MFSSEDQMVRIAEHVVRYMLFPYCNINAFDGKVLEAIIAFVRGVEKLDTKEFIDIYQEEDEVGLTVKSTKSHAIPVLMRLVDPNLRKMLRNSVTKSDWNELGKEIVKFVNRKAQIDFEHYHHLESIIYSRLMIFPNRMARYYECLLCTRHQPEVIPYSSDELFWEPSSEAGFHCLDGNNNEILAWNPNAGQLRFSMDKLLYPPKDSPHSISFGLPNFSKRISWESMEQTYPVDLNQDTPIEYRKPRRPKCLEDSKSSSSGDLNLCF